jgi:hypothetical protein
VPDLDSDAAREHLLGLVVLNPTGLFFHSLADGGVAFDADGRSGTWHWPRG